MTEYCSCYIRIVYLLFNKVIENRKHARYMIYTLSVLITVSEEQYLLQETSRLLLI